MKTKTIIAMLFSIAMLISFSACENQSAEETQSTNENVIISSEPEKSNVTFSEMGDTEASTGDENSTTGTIEELNDVNSKDVEDMVAEIDTFDKYLANTDKVEAFYTNSKAFYRQRRQIE